MPQHPPRNNTRFAGPENPYVHDAPDGKKIQHLLWGDWLSLKPGQATDADGVAWREVVARNTHGWMRESDYQRERVLEIVFVDVGQGDGCLMVTPEDEHIVIDAGDDDSMFRFLNWRYGGFRSPWEFDVGIISHPDADHYRGFEELFQVPNVTFGTIYQNGILEYRGDDPLGPRRRIDGRNCVTEICRTEADLDAFLAVDAHWKHPDSDRWNKEYGALLNTGRTNGSFQHFRALSRQATPFVPGYGPTDGKSLTLEVMGPVLDEDAQGAGLRWFGSKGKTKNGHSVVLKLRYNDLTVMLGGDLNIPSQEHLLHHHTGLDPRPVTRDDHDQLIRAARLAFEVDVAKACHHGAADVSTRFLQATNPIATVISSGDQEPHAHPRADALGATGKHGRGNRPLLFSTELGRSWRNTIKRPEALKARLRDLREQIEIAPADSTIRRRLIREFETIVDSLDRSVAVYGAIHLRTDGHDVVMAQKLEEPRGASKWDIYRLVREGGVLRYVSRYD